MDINSTKIIVIEFNIKWRTVEKLIWKMEEALLLGINIVSFGATRDLYAHKIKDKNSCRVGKILGFM